MYRPFLHSRDSDRANDILLKEDGNFINDRKVLAELFNYYFANILEDTNEITEVDYGTDFIEHPSIRAIMHNKVEKETFSFELVNSSQVDLLSTVANLVVMICYIWTLLKLSAPITALPMSRIINSSIISRSYPVRWKMSQVTLLFKKEDELFKNYRPVTVLPFQTTSMRESCLINYRYTADSRQLEPSGETEKGSSYREFELPGVENKWPEIRKNDDPVHFYSYNVHSHNEKKNGVYVHSYLYNVQYCTF